MLRYVRHCRCSIACSILFKVILQQKVNATSVRAWQLSNANITPSSVINCDPKLNPSKYVRCFEAVLRPLSDILQPSKPIESNCGNSLAI